MGEPESLGDGADSGHKQPGATVAMHAQHLVEQYLGRRRYLAFYLVSGVFGGVAYLVLNILGEGDLVIAERLDRTRTSLGDVDLPCTGVFEMEGGKIKVWRDYFDLNTFMSAMK